MRRSGPWFDALRAFMESAVYSPVWVLPALLIIESFVPEVDSWWIRQFHSLREKPMLAWSIVGVLVSLRPILVYLAWLSLVSVGIVFVRRSWAEKLGDELVNRICQRRRAPDVGAELLKRCEQGNVDIEHLDGTLWLWVFARYEGDLEIESKCAHRVHRHLTNEQLRSRMQVWCLRAHAKLALVAPDVLPPMCEVVIRQS
jgi:hypothetical protein